MARNPELERPLFDDFESREAWQVYGDWLQQQGDPYGERIALELQLEQAKDEDKARLENRIAEFEAPHRSEWSGSKTKWERGFIVAAEIAGSKDDNDLPSTLLDSPCARFLRTLLFQPTDPKTFPSKPLEALRELLLADLVEEFLDIDIGPLDPWLSAAPRLEHLDAHGSGIIIETLEHPRLERVRLTVLRMPESTVQAIGRCRLPNLEHLHVEFFTRFNAGSNDMLEDLYTGRGVPRLRRLSLQDAEFLRDDVAESIATSKLLEQLTHLDLSGGTISDVGAAVILANAKRFSHLEHFNLGDNYIPYRMWARLEEALPMVVLDSTHLRDE